MAGPVRMEAEDGVVRLTLDRPKARNALDDRLIEALDERLRALRDDADARVVVLAGAGETFCAGLDVSEVKDVADPEQRRLAFAPIARRRVRLLGRTLERLFDLPQVTIAKLDGYAIGGGFSLALACDLRVASERAQCWFPEVDLGLPLSPASTGLLAAQVGPAVAKEIVLTCRRLAARDLESLGIVNDVVDASVLGDAVDQLAESLARKDRRAVTISKSTLNAFVRRAAVIRPDLLVPDE